MMEGKFVEKFIDFINEYYSKDENCFYIYDNVDNCEHLTSVNDDNVEYTSNLFRSVRLDRMSSGDKLFIHGFFLNHFVEYGKYATKRLSRNQLVLIIYGADLYNNRYILQKNFLHPGVWLQEYKKKQLIKKIGLFMTFASPDYDLMHKWFGANGKQFDILYPSNANFEQLSTIRNLDKDNNKIVRILLGNSATSTNRHEEALEWLKKYKEENIQIICPLSYGDMVYGGQIVTKGQEIFGDKFIPVTDYMDIEDYTDLLNSVDIAVYNNNRQQATGNIEILGYLGKKIYVRSDIATWGHYVVRDGCRFFDTTLIPYMRYEEFCGISREDIDYNEQYFLNIWNNDYLKTLWDKVMQYGN